MSTRKADSKKTTRGRRGVVDSRSKKKAYTRPAITEEHEMKFSSLGTQPPGGMPGC